MVQNNKEATFVAMLATVAVLATATAMAVAATTTAAVQRQRLAKKMPWNVVRGCSSLAQCWQMVQSQPKQRRPMAFGMTRGAQLKSAWQKIPNAVDAVCQRILRRERGCAVNPAIIVDVVTPAAAASPHATAVPLL